MTSITTFFMFDVPPKRGHTDSAARRLDPTSLLRNVRSCYSEKPGMENL
jgi:hypothetical protein